MLGTPRLLEGIDEMSIHWGLTRPNAVVLIKLRWHLREIKVRRQVKVKKIGALPANAVAEWSPEAWKWCVLEAEKRCGFEHKGNSVGFSLAGHTDEWMRVWSGAASLYLALQQDCTLEGSVMRGQSPEWRRVPLCSKSEQVREPRNGDV